MFVEFITNLGSRDAQRFNLDYTQCTKGAVIEVENTLGDSLCRKDDNGMTFAKPAEAPKKVKAIGPEPEIKGK